MVEETDWAAAAEEAASAAAGLNDDNGVPSTTDDEQFHDQPHAEEDEEWVNAEDADNDVIEDDYDDEVLSVHEDAAEHEQQELEQHQEQQEHDGPRQTPWILRVAIPGAPDDDTANIYIDSGMTAERLGRCVSQAVSFENHTGGNNGYAPQHKNNGDRIGGNYQYGALVGLFGKHDRVFYSLECILSMSSREGELHTFCVHKPMPPALARTTVPNQQKQQGNPSVTTGNLVVAFMVVVIYMVLSPNFFRLYEHGSNVVFAMFLWMPQDLPSMWNMVSYALDWPARELYRYGPSFVGWEGRDLIEICTQMHRPYYFIGTYGGNDYEERQYWRQNPELCATIYRMKEESFARMCRPVWYTVVAGLNFLALHKLISIVFQPPPPPRLPGTDRAVLDVYRALQFLLREHTRQEQQQQRHQPPIMGPGTGQR